MIVVKQGGRMIKNKSIQLNATIYGQPRGLALSLSKESYGSLTTKGELLDYENSLGNIQKCTKC